MDLNMLYVMVLLQIYSVIINIFFLKKNHINSFFSKENNYFNVDLCSSWHKHWPNTL